MGKECQEKTKDEMNQELQKAPLQKQPLSSPVEVKDSVEFVPWGAEDSIKLSVAIIRKYVAAPAFQELDGRTVEVLPSDSECVKFMMLCRSRRLNCFEGDAFMVPFWNGKSKRHEWALVTAHNAYLKRAETHDAFEGMESGVILERETGAYVEAEGDFVPSLHDGEKVTLVGGWAKVHRKDRKIVTYRRAKLSIFQQAFGQWVKNPGGMIVKCFDHETEVLTTRGFERFVNAEGRVLQVAENGLEPTDAVPFVQTYSGPMIKYDSDDLNFCVTPNHDMVTTQGTIEAGALFEAARMRPKFWIPRIVQNSQPDGNFTDRQLKLAAVFIADGSIHRQRSGNCHSFVVGVSKQRKIDFLDAIGNARYRYTKECAGQEAHTETRVITTRHNKVVFYFQNSELGDLVDENKVINTDLVLALSQRQARIFVDTLIEFDGTVTPQGTRRFYSSRPQNVGAFELAAVQAGYSVSFRRERTSDISTKLNYFVSISDRDIIPVRRIGRELKGRSKPDQHSFEYYPSLERVSNPTNHVWCVTVPSGRIVVRRRGFSHICGNCAEADALRSAFPSLLGGLYLKEEIGIQSTVMMDDKPQIKRPEFVKGLPSVTMTTETAPKLDRMKGVVVVKNNEPQQEAKTEPVVTEPTPEPEPEPTNSAQEASDAASQAPDPVQTAPEPEPAAVGQPDPLLAPKQGDSDALASVKLLAAKSGVTYEQLWTYLVTNKAGKDGQKIADLATSKLEGIARAWPTILGKIKA